VAKEIMYVGRKDQKVDNKNNVPTRVWRGLGAVIKNIPDLEGEKLAAHPDIWLDVTKMDQSGRETVIASLQDKYRREARKAREGQAITLEQATDEELEAMLKKRKSTRGKAASNPINPDLVPQMPAAGSHGNESDERHRPENTEDLGADIFGAIADLDSEKDFDGENKPYLERVVEKLGYQITQQELSDVWAAYNTK
jgi:hypothetical protein